MSGGTTAALPLELIRRLRELLRQHQGRAAQPSACIVDSQMIKAPMTRSARPPAATTGGKKITGRVRHLAIDTPRAGCWPWWSPPPSASDKAGAKLLIIRLFDAFSTLKIMWADCSFWRAAGRYARAAAAITVEKVVKRSAPAFLPGPAPPVGHRAHLRLADALPPPGP